MNSNLIRYLKYLCIGCSNKPLKQFLFQWLKNQAHMKYFRLAFKIPSIHFTWDDAGRNIVLFKYLPIQSCNFFTLIEGRTCSLFTRPKWWFVTRKWLEWIIKHLSFSNLRNQFFSLCINERKQPCCRELAYASQCKTNKYEHQSHSTLNLHPNG